MLERSIQSSNMTSLKLDHPSKLVDGQMIFARVNKLLPEGMAEINYNGRKIIAELEAPLTAGKNYLLKAEAGNDGLLTLRVISGSASEADSPLVDKILSELQLPRAGNMKEVLSLLMKSSLSFNRTELTLISDLLASTQDKQAGIEALMKIKEGGLPVSKPLYFSYLHGKSMEPMSKMLSDVETVLLTNGPKSPAAEKVLGIISNMNESETANLLQKAAHRSSEMLSSSDPGNAQKSSAFKLLQSLGLIPEESVLAEGKPLPVKELINTQPAAGFLNSSPPLSQIKDKLISLLELVGGNPAPDERFLTYIKEIHTVLKSMESGKMANQELLKTAAALFSEGDSILSQKGLMPPLSERERFNLLFGLHTRREKELISGFSQKLQQLQQNSDPEQPAMKLLQQLTVNDEGNAPQLHKEALPDIIKDLASRLGINHEAKLAAGHPQDRSLYDSLKPALVSLLKEVPQGEAREAAENLLFKLNGPAILSGENGPLQNVIYQFPLTWLNQKTDVRMQWSGRRMENGQIDPEFCRVLFYLELENIKEVIVDMGVQNRIITLNIYNDTPSLKELAGPFSPVLREGLERMHYKVSAINFKSPEETGSSKKMYQAMAGEVTYSGVDLKI
ncbi:hypothetical protein D3H55_05645 [Bacillus salacetis]|uniref:Flagellar hook-length control protein FliK n=1 Tax=Bacillus salacetis TaxID=2315464 RepID=A0A3A1R6R8_9BACI|nr:hypothetical protein [Bacillus salacetis]RIW36392.1 hypothetical protein D3H55_05645 [Bacillus salacetis]